MSPSGMRPLILLIRVRSCLEAMSGGGARDLDRPARPVRPVPRRTSLSIHLYRDWPKTRSDDVDDCDDDVAEEDEDDEDVEENEAGVKFSLSSSKNRKSTDLDRFDDDAAAAAADRHPDVDDDDAAEPVELTDSSFGILTLT